MTETPENTEKLAALKLNAKKALAAHDAFNTIVETYLDLSGEAKARFGLEAGGQMELVYRLRRGTDFRASTRRRVLAHIAGAGAQSA